MNFASYCEVSKLNGILLASKILLASAQYKYDPRQPRASSDPPDNFAPCRDMRRLLRQSAGRKRESLAAHRFCQYPNRHDVSTPFLSVALPQTFSLCSLIEARELII
jgi:hypothetical protein